MFCKLSGEQWQHVVFNSLRPLHNAQRFDCMTKYLEKPWQFSQQLVQVIVGNWLGNKPLFEPILTSSISHLASYTLSVLFATISGTVGARNGEHVTILTILFGPNAVFQERWYNYYPIHDYNKLDRGKQMNNTGLFVTICLISSWPGPVYQHILTIYCRCNQYDSSMLGGHQFAPQEI